MANIVDGIVHSPLDNASPTHEKTHPRLWRRIALSVVVVLSIFMNFFQLGQNGYGNLYYAAGVKSMADSLHNFFFVSFDPGGFVTIDKPPLGFWLQTLSSKIFGFTPFSIFLPQAICGVLSVLLLYYLVQRHFGFVAGLVAALALAVSPISVVTDRNNTIDGTLALAILLAAWAVIHAAETGKLRWLLLSGIFVGLGFNIKMAEAYLIVPALGLTYLLCAPRTIWTRIWHLLLVAVVMLAISMSWALAVDLTPPAQRPYVGSTQDNSELSLAFGYNGLSRLRIGGNNGFGGRNRAGTNRGGTSDTTGSRTTAAGAASNTGNTALPATPSPTGSSASGTANQPTAPSATGNGGAFAGGGAFAAGGAFGGGTPGPFRLFGVGYGDQIAWLLPFALLAILALIWQRRLNFRKDRQQLGLVLWGFWLLTMAIFFTVDSSFHQYYMTEMAPGLSALVGIGLVIMWGDYRRPGWRGWLLPLALAVTAAAQIYMLRSFPAWSQWLSPIIGVLTALVVIGLIFLRLRPRLNLNLYTFQVSSAVVSVGILALLLAPTIWSGYSVLNNTESSFPTAGPGAGNDLGGFANARGGGGGQNRNLTGAQSGLAGAFAGLLGGGSGQADASLIAYLEAHQGNAKFLVATPSSNTADTLILSANKPVIAMGGFSGGDPILTTSDLQALIKAGTVRFFLVSSPGANRSLLDQIPEQYRDLLTGTDRNAGGFGGLGGQQSALSSWVNTHCNAVPAGFWSSTGSAVGGNQLYDCHSPKP